MMTLDGILGKTFVLKGFRHFLGVEHRNHSGGPDGYWGVSRYLGSVEDLTLITVYH